MPKQHRYSATITWSEASGTVPQLTYTRNHAIAVAGKPDIPASADPAFRGDPSRYNPEDLLVASLSSCHMLWYLHLCARAGILVTRYVDQAEGTLRDDGMKGGRFERVTLHPRVTIRQGDAETAKRLHHDAHKLCFVAQSVNFPVDCEPVIEAESADEPAR